LRAVILHGYVPPDAPPDEQDVLVQADMVEDCLCRYGYTVARVPFTFDLGRVRDELFEHEADIVFNLVESVEGRGRFIHLATTLLDAMCLPYTGSRNEAVFTTSSKTLAKSIMDMWAVPTPKWQTLETLAAVEPGRRMPGGYIIKSVWEHGSVGIDETSVMDAPTAGELYAGIHLRSEAHGQEFFAESFIDGREFNISLLESEGGPLVLPPAEMLFDGYSCGERRILDYASKWDGSSSRYNGSRRSFDFAERDRELLVEIRDLAARCWRFFGLNGYARVDFRVDRLGRPWVLEVNANPCLSPDAGFMAAAGRAGMDKDGVVRAIVEAGLAPSERAPGRYEAARKGV